MSTGVDYAFGSPSKWASAAWSAALKAAGVTFAGRYMSDITANDVNGKNLLKAELAGLLAADLSVVVVEESTAGRMKAGSAAGIADGQHAKAVTAALGMEGIPVYFACDFDATPADHAPINAYLDGAASVIGLSRTGIYGGYYPVKRALDAGKAAYAWQTSAWSGGQWDPRAHIRQHGSVSVGDVTVDFDEAVAADFGQWPRPAASAAVPAPTGLKQAAVTSDVRLSWNRVPGQTGYQLQTEWYKPGFGWVLQADGPVTGAYTAKGLPAGRYRWRVAAGTGNRTWSAWKEFEV